MRLGLAGSFNMVCETNRRVKNDSRLWGDDLLKEFVYGEVRDDSITRQAQEVKTNCLKMFLFHCNTETREHIIYAQHQHPDKGKNNICRNHRPLVFLPIKPLKGDHAPDSNTLV